MINAGNFVTKQCNLLLEKKQYAIFYAVLFAVLPFTSWVSVVLVMLITLRKGGRISFEILFPALIAHFVPCMTFLPLGSALINTAVSYLPCFIAALCLRKTRSWQMVFAVFFLQALVVFLLIQLLAPNFVMGQFYHFKMILANFQEYQYIIDGISSIVLAQLFMGIQIVSVVAGALFSLLFARSLQSRLFMPGGFSAELLEIRSGKLSFVVLLGISIASYNEMPLALNLLPLVLCNFLISGFSLVYYIWGKKSQVKFLILLFLLTLFRPSFVLLAYIVFGSLDSLFNFRLYLPARAKKST